MFICLLNKVSGAAPIGLLFINKPCLSTAVYKQCLYTDDRAVHANQQTVCKHVFINSVLGDYIDHMKGKRKIKGKSSRSDLRSKKNQDYWKNVENYDPFGGVKFDPKQTQDIISKVAKGKQGN